MTPPLPHNESGRLAALQTLGVGQSADWNRLLK